MKEYIYLILFFWTVNYSGQKQTNIWYFGSNAGLDFSNGSPFQLTNGQLNTLEGCSSIADSTGKLLFYTDGITVWNKMHQQMVNGNNLKGNISSTQSALIVPKPHSNHIYYIFTTDTKDSPMDPGGFDLRYSEVDMSLQSGLGEVTRKNIFLFTPSCEKIAGIRHCNGNDVWVATHEWNSNAFHVYLVDSSGVLPNPTISFAGSTIAYPYGNRIGQMKASSDGKKLASVTQIDQLLEVFDFDNSTGVVSNPLIFPRLEGECYGVEFSPDGSKIYATTASPDKIYQVDLNAGDSIDILHSSIPIASSEEHILYGSLQLGPDKKIYVARAGQYTLAVINDPDAKGTACNYSPDGPQLTPYSSFYGLPGFVNSYRKVVPHPVTFTLNCLNASFVGPRSDGISDVESYSWNFGDAASKDKDTSFAANPSHLFTEPGEYEITLYLSYKCRGTETMKEKVIVAKPVPKPTQISGVTAFCEDQMPVISAILNGSYKWSTGQTTPSLTLPPVSQEYSVMVTDASGCTYTASKSVTVNPFPVVSASFIPGREITGQLIAGGAGLYEWYPPYGLSCSVCQSPKVNLDGDSQFCVKGTDMHGCSNVACTDASVSTVYIPNTFTPNKDGLNDLFMPIVREISNYRLAIYNRWGEEIFKSSDPENAWDGQCKNEKSPEGIYLYKLELNNRLNGQPYQYTGTVSLIR